MRLSAGRSLIAGLLVLIGASTLLEVFIREQLVTLDDV